MNYALIGIVKCELTEVMIQACILSASPHCHITGDSSDYMAVRPSPPFSEGT